MEMLKCGPCYKYMRAFVFWTHWKSKMCALCTWHCKYIKYREYVWILIQKYARNHWGCYPCAYVRIFHHVKCSWYDTFYLEHAKHNNEMIYIYSIQMDYGSFFLPSWARRIARGDGEQGMTFPLQTYSCKCSDNLTLLNWSEISILIGINMPFQLKLLFV